MSVRNGAAGWSAHFTHVTIFRGKLFLVAIFYNNLVQVVVVGRFGRVKAQPRNCGIEFGHVGRPFRLVQ
eukprot:scaffold9209_cov157-Amphora_coffeaeformis.AAC.1